MSKRINWLLFYILIFVSYFLISIPYYSGDIKNHLAWGKSIAEIGAYGFFERTFPGYSFPTYPPFVTLLFALSYFLYQFALFIIQFLNASLAFFPSKLVWFFQWENTEIAFLKLSGIIPVILLGVLFLSFWKLFKDEIVLKDKFLIWVVILLNPAMIYIAGVWGQTDALQNLLILTAFYFLFKKKIWVGAVFSGLALLSKQTVLIIFGVYLLTTLKLYGIRKLFITLVIAALVFYLGYLPFYGLSLDKPVIHYFNSIRLVDFGVAENAVNLWGALFNFRDASSNQTFLSISLDNWGYIMFLVLALPLTFLFWIRKFEYRGFFLYMFLISIIYFFVLTRMHERYLIPSVVFATILLSFGIKYWINLIFFSLLHFLNLYRGLFQPDIPYLSILVRDQTFLNILVVGYILLIVYNYYLFVKNET